MLNTTVISFHQNIVSFTALSRVIPFGFLEKLYGS